MTRGIINDGSKLLRRIRVDRVDGDTNDVMERFVVTGIMGKSGHKIGMSPKAMYATPPL